MTIAVDISRAKATLARLIALAESGEEVIITLEGKPVVELRALREDPPSPHRRIGAFAHLGSLSDAEAEFLISTPGSRQDPAR